MVGRNFMQTADLILQPFFAGGGGITKLAMFGKILQVLAFFAVMSIAEEKLYKAKMKDVLAKYPGL